MELKPCRCDLLMFWALDMLRQLKIYLNNRNLESVVINVAVN